MCKIIEIREDVVSIGTDQGSIEEVRTSDINFVPHIGDEVEMFKTETRTIVSKVEKKEPTQEANGGINVNVQNQANNSGGPVLLANGKKAVKKVVYCLLACFLGGVGAHKFYAGKTGSGILYLLLFWTTIPIFVSFVEFISGLCKKSDENGMILV